MILIPASLTLIALAGGMFLLAKTNKDNLGIFFKIISLFIIIGSFMNFGAIGIRCAMQFHNPGMGMDMDMQHGMMMKQYEKKMFKKMHGWEMGGHHGMMDGYSGCSEMKEHCGNMECNDCMKDCAAGCMEGCSMGCYKRGCREMKDTMMMEKRMERKK
jgi:hypothetical protein